jgi:hypothetical protein
MKNCAHTLVLVHTQGEIYLPAAVNKLKRTALHKPPYVSFHGVVLLVPPKLEEPYRVNFLIS